MGLSVAFTPEDVIARVASDQNLVCLADELHDTLSVSDELWADLRAAFAEEAIL
jgi:hypothetical protein